ncbi:hypothetical protein KNP414_01921 [Paenibacillus mucilaginosus KNP414]|uniref:Uncharacterized protein n=1 Tax=Paenibacillus mucilaginosus (strain KNP414) TaxID=1036673 RepID=F8FR45_PAEMK|nr:hypothetical protein KNP414_01921 [Paenibacillus mucilaginosus KNP414]
MVHKVDALIIRCGTGCSRQNGQNGSAESESGRDQPNGTRIHLG